MATLRADLKLDEALEETFPASDPTAHTVETGIRVGETSPPRIVAVSDNRLQSRFKVTLNGHPLFWHTNGRTMR